MNNAYQAYQTNSVMTASSAQLTLMLYNGALTFCNQAIECLEKRNIEGAHNANIKAQNIITELQATLDKKYKVAEEMDVLYEFIQYNLVEANMEKKPEKLIIAKEFITEFRDVWKEIMSR